jgi:hypothetical protein
MAHLFERLPIPAQQPYCNPVGAAFQPRFSRVNIDGVVKSPKMLFSVIPTKAGIHLFHNVLDPGVRWGDDQRDFLRIHQY